MYADKPVFKETLWEWRAFGIRVDPNICRNILNLPIKDGKSIKMLNRYICREGRDINIKIRDEDLKVKNLHDKTLTKIIAVPLTKIYPTFSTILDINDIQENGRTQLKHFIEHHKDLKEGKYVKVAGWEGKDAAKIRISEAIRRYNRKIDV